MTDWSSGAVFAVIWLALSVPIHLIAMYFFWQRREIQPIKARFPTLVMSNDLVLLAWEIFLCVQRIVVDEYPCLLNLWTGFIGLTVLFNTYIWRCWVLYFTYGLARERLDGVKKEDSFFLKHRFLANNQFLSQILGTLTVLLNLPAGIITAQSPEISELQGDNCNRGKGDIIMGVYVLLYLTAFSALAWKLRQVVDGFKIKEELKFTAALCPVIFVPWLIFNNFARTVNKDVFPFSTFFLLVGVFFAFSFSTLWPLYKSYFGLVQLEDLNVSSDNLRTLEGLLSEKPGLASFKKFLTKEFSVENILFYEEIEEYRNKKRKASDDTDLLGEAQRLYAKYIINDSPFQVNLPDIIIRDLETNLKDLFTRAAQSGHSVPALPANKKIKKKYSEADINEDSSLSKSMTFSPKMSVGGQILSAREPPTIFDRAQENIFKLMNSDSFPRYQRSEEYKLLLDEVSKRETKVTILEEVGIIEKKDIPSPRSTSKSQNK